MFAPSFWNNCVAHQNIMYVNKFENFICVFIVSVYKSYSEINKTWKNKQNAAGI